MTTDADFPPSETVDERTRRLRRIRRLSSGLKWAVTGLLVAVALFTAATLWIVIVPDVLDVARAELVLEFGEVERSLFEVPLAQRLGLAVLVVWIFGLALLLMWTLRQLFERFRRQDFYSSRTLSLVMRTGWLLLALGVSDILTDMIGSVLLTLDRPVGERQLALSLDGSQVFFLVFGPLSLVFGWVLREAALAHEENRQFV